MRILLFGKNGQIGWELQRSLAPLGNVLAFGKGDVDFANPRAVEAFLSGWECDVIVNAAAFTAVDRAEVDVDRARAVNERSVSVLATHAAKIGCMLVHYSTDYVFDGSSARPYLEDDVPNPLSVYGHTKWNGEKLIAKSGCRHVIFRTTWVHGARGDNFVRTILDLARNNEELRIISDQFGAPTSSELVADVTAHVLHRTSEMCGLASQTLHLSASGETSWHEYANFIVSHAPSMGFELATKPDHVVPITMSEFARPARRPANCRLDTTKLVGQFALQMPNWKNGVLRTMQEISEARR